jgi:hypothetical protein
MILIVKVFSSNKLLKLSKRQMQLTVNMAKNLYKGPQKLKNMVLTLCPSCFFTFFALK